MNKESRETREDICLYRTELMTAGDFSWQLSAQFPCGKRTAYICSMLVHLRTRLLAWQTSCSQSLAGSETKQARFPIAPQPVQGAKGEPGACSFCKAGRRAREKERLSEEVKESSCNTHTHTHSCMYRHTVSSQKHLIASRWAHLDFLCYSFWKAPFCIREVDWGMGTMRKYYS